MKNVPRATITPAQKALFQDLSSNLVATKQSNRVPMYGDSETTPHEYTNKEIFDFNTPAILASI